MIDWEGVKIPTRDTDWTSRGVKKPIEIRKTGAHSMNRDAGCNQLTNFVLQAAGEEDVAIYKWHSSSPLMMLIDRVRRN